jgi:hypothetical protein
MNIQNILWASDGSKESEEALNYSGFRLTEEGQPG